MSFFKIMNDLMDYGWKMTDFTHKVCKSNALIDDSKTTLFCCKCNEEVFMDESVQDEL